MRTRPWWWSAIQWALAALVLLFLVRTFARNWDELQAQRLSWHVRPGLLIASAALVWAMYACLIAAWRGVLRGWNQRLGPWEAGRIWTISNLGKYLPGKVWALAGMAMLAQRAGVSPWAATASAIVMQAVGIGTGAAVVAFSGTRALETAHPGATTALWVVGVLSAASVILLVWPPMASRLVRRLSPESAGAPPSPSGVVGGVLANVVAWSGYGAALWLLARGLLPEISLDLSLAIGAFAASYLAGLLFLPAPGGIGVREGVLIVMLQPSLGLAGATALTVASRLLLTVTEVGAAVPFLVFRRGVSNGRT